MDAKAEAGNEVAEAKKKEGNDFLLDKKYDEAIRCYSEAIDLDKNNHIYWSNRSAAHASKKEFYEAIADAKECIKLNGKFIKGYYRLASAQLEMKDFESATNTVADGLKVEPSNSDLIRLDRTIKNKKRAAVANAKRTSDSSNSEGTSTVPVGGGGGVRLDEATRKEFMELTEQAQATAKDLAENRSMLQGCKNERRRIEITGREVADLPASVRMFESVGRMFMLSPREDVMGNLSRLGDKLTKKEEDVTGRVAYLERRLSSQQSNLKEIMQNASTEAA